jgi:hypothetical protein
MTDVADLKFLAHVLRADLTPNLSENTLQYEIYSSRLTKA